MFLSPLFILLFFNPFSFSMYLSRFAALENIVFNVSISTTFRCLKKIPIFIQIDSLSIGFSLSFFLTNIVLLRERERERETERQRDREKLCATVFVTFLHTHNISIKRIVILKRRRRGRRRGRERS